MRHTAWCEVWQQCVDSHTQLISRSCAKAGTMPTHYCFGSTLTHPAVSRFFFSLFFSILFFFNFAHMQVMPSLSVVLSL
eukprot:m.11516 g.11516  ORF g.11516 m.11516 type:complete len:79 (-) comp2849_c0_seq1:18-254(-)